MRLQALLGDRAIDLLLDGSAATVGERTAEVRVHRLGPHTLHILVDGRSHVVTVEPGEGQGVRVTVGGQTVPVQLKDERALLLERLGLADAGGEAARELRAPMPGLVLQVLVEPGQTVEPGAGLVVLEAMKMENELRAVAAGTVATVHATPGAAVSKGDLLVSFES